LSGTTTVLRSDRAETTRVTVALVAREGKPASPYSDPACGVVPDIDDKPDGAAIAGGSSCAVRVLEPCFKASAHEANGGGA
jgi:hypothetical protein